MIFGNIGVYTLKKPEIGRFLSDRFKVEDKGIGYTMEEVLNPERVPKQILVIWGQDDDFVNLTIDQEPRLDRYPRYTGEPRPENFRRYANLYGDIRFPEGVWEKIYRDAHEKSHGIKLIADEELYGLFEDSQLMCDPPKIMRRFLGLLQRTHGKPTYHTNLELSIGYGSESGKIKNSVAIARMVADQFDGHIWSTFHEEFGNPEIEDMIAYRNGPNLFEILQKGTNPKKPTLHLVE